jgi:hypothetical protein
VKSSSSRCVSVCAVGGREGVETDERVLFVVWCGVRSVKVSFASTEVIS